MKVARQLCGTCRSPARAAAAEPWPAALRCPLAEGRLQLAAVEPEPGCSGDELLLLAAAAERNTRHPLADALVAAAEAKGERLDLGWKGCACVRWGQALWCSATPYCLRWFAG